MKFDEQWQKIKPEDRDKFIAEQVYNLDQRVAAIEAKAGINGLVGGGGIALLITAGEYLARRIGWIK